MKIVFIGVYANNSSSSGLWRWYFKYDIFEALNDNFEA